MTTPDTAAPATDAGVSVKRTSPNRRAVIGAFAVLGALGAASGAAAPTVLGWADPLWAGAFGALTAWAASRGRRWTWFWLAGWAGLSTALSWPFGWLVVVALVAAWAGLRHHRRDRVLGALIGACCVTALAHGGDLGPAGAASAMAAVATVPVWVSAFRGGSVRLQLRLRTRTTRALVALAVVVGVGALVALSAVPGLYDAVNDAQAGAEALRGGDEDNAARRFARAEDRFATATGRLDSPLVQPLRAVPLVAQHVDALTELAHAGRELADAAFTLADAAPYASLGATAGRIDLDVLRAMQAPAGEAAESLERAVLAADGIASDWLVPPVAEQVRVFRDQVVDTADEVDLAVEGLAVAPALLGGDGPRTYLLLFTTPTEARELGGFVGSWGVLGADDGALTLVETGRSAELTVLIPPEGLDLDPVASTGFGRYRTSGAHRFFQNVTLSPDAPTVAALATDSYEQLTGTRVNGVVIVDPTGLAALMALTGPITVPELDGRTFASDEVEQYLWSDQYLEFDGARDERRDALADLAAATFDGLVERDLPELRRATNVLGPATAGGHLLFVPADDDEAAFFDHVGALGRFATGEGADWFAVRSTNDGGNKLDFFLRRRVTYDAVVDPTTDTVQATATIEVINDAPPRGLPAYVASNPRSRPAGTNLSTLSVYTPLGVRSASVDGVRVPVSSHRVGAGWVYDVRVVVPPSSSVVVQLELDGAVGLDDGYSLALARQPLVHDDELDVTVRVEGGYLVRPNREFVDGGTLRRSGPHERTEHLEGEIYLR